MMTMATMVVRRPLDIPELLTGSAAGVGGGGGITP
jgi:hypothetical protein